MKKMNTTTHADLTNTDLPDINLISDKLPQTVQTTNGLNTWSLYIIADKFGHFYTGITTDVQARFLTHQSGKGAKALRGKLPLKLIYQCVVGNRSLAAQYECRVKRLSKQQKQALVNANQSVIDFFLP